MAKNFFITDFTDVNYVKCLKSTQPVNIKLGCHKCEHFNGGGVEDGKCYLNCNLLKEDNNIQTKMRYEDVKTN